MKLSTAACLSKTSGLGPLLITDPHSFLPYSLEAKLGNKSLLSFSEEGVALTRFRLQNFERIRALCLSVGELNTTSHKGSIELSARAENLLLRDHHTLESDGTIQRLLKNPSSALPLSFTAEV